MWKLSLFGRLAPCKPCPLGRGEGGYIIFTKFLTEKPAFQGGETSLLIPGPIYRCNRHARNQPIDIISISYFEYIRVHIFLCKGPQFFVHIIRETSDRQLDDRQRQLKW
jgi:hypothetical protein